jgi:hypothetical protein
VSTGSTGYGPLVAAVAGLITSAFGIVDPTTQGYVKVVLAALGTALVGLYVQQAHKTARNGDTAAASIATAAAVNNTAAAAATAAAVAPLPGVAPAGTPGVVQASPANLIPADQWTGTVLAGSPTGPTPTTADPAGKHEAP